MYAYTMTQWLAFFYLYCIFGWCFESAYVSLQKRRPVNRGFMTGPYLPLYGSGAVLVLFVTLPVRDHYVLMYISGAVAATILEYFTGVAMEKMFRVRYWDYSDQKFNFQGQICLSSTIAWGFLTLFLVEVVQRPIERLIFMVDEEWLTGMTFVFTVIFTFDFASSFRTAIDLRDILIQVERAGKELQLMQKRLEVLEAVLNDSVENMVDGFEEKLESRVSEGKLRVSELTEEKMADLMGHVDAVRQRLDTSEGIERVRAAVEAANLDERLEDLQKEMLQMRGRMENMAVRIKAKAHPRNIRMLYRNPSATSSRYREEWQYLKNKIMRSHDEKDV